MTDVLRLLTGGTNRVRKSSEPSSILSVSNSRRKPKVHSNYPLEPLASYTSESCLATPIRKSMVTLGYPDPTEIQRQLIPAMLGQHDVIATAETGSGKTFAFLLPIFSVLDPKKSGIGGLVVAPTRELATQIVAESSRFLSVCSRKHCVTLLDAKKSSPSSGVVVSTPLRLLQTLNSGELSLSSLQFLVLDEADKLLDLGFLVQLDSLLEHYKLEQTRRRTAGESLSVNLTLVSATLPEKVVALATACMADAVRITVGHSQAANLNIHQKLIFTGNEGGKISVVRQMAREGQLKPPCIVFVESKERAVELTNELLFDGLMVDAIHADRTKYDRDRTVQAFREGKIWVLVATDVLGRGIDFQNVEQVINFDVPKTSATYIHRIGRTGRAGRKGEAITLFTQDDVEVMRPIINVMRESQIEVPEWLVKAVPKKDKRKATNNIEYSNKRRKTIDTAIRKNANCCFR